MHQQLNSAIMSPQDECQCLAPGATSGAVGHPTLLWACERSAAVGFSTCTTWLRSAVAEMQGTSVHGGWLSCGKRASACSKSNPWLHVAADMIDAFHVWLRTYTYTSILCAETVCHDVPRTLPWLLASVPFAHSLICTEHVAHDFISSPYPLWR